MDEARALKLRNRAVLDRALQVAEAEQLYTYNVVKQPAGQAATERRQPSGGLLRARAPNVSIRSCLRALRGRRLGYAATPPTAPRPSTPQCLEISCS